MRIGLLTTSYPRHLHDPAGSFVAGMAHWLADQGDEVEVLAPAPARDDHPRVTVRSIRCALAPRLFYGAGAPDNLREPAAWMQVPAFVGRLGLECRRRSAGWDATISHWLVPSAFVASLVRRDLPHVAVAHSSDVHLLRRLASVSALLLHGIATPRTRLVLTAEALRPMLKHVARTAPARCLVRDAVVARMGISAADPPSTIHAEAISLRARHGLHRRTVALFLGRLVSVKGVDCLLEACAGLPDLAVVIAGDGPERTVLEALAERRGINARFVGYQVGPAKAAWLAAADIFALPSVVLADGRTDSAPVALLEAMAAGVPVIATEIGGNAELIRTGENGLLVPPGEVEALRTALGHLAQDPALRRRLGERGRATARLHTWDHVGPRIRELLGSR
jgi:glycosyltransferase involved in cell wall biosynthesis